MTHLPALIGDLAVILMTAAVVTLIFRALKQPVVLGYLIAGLLVGPHFSFVPTISDTESIKVWAEIGVIFLMFALGLEFSIKKLAHVGKSAVITALFETHFMMALGLLTGQLIGWSRIDSLFLGAIMAISSTTIIVKAFDELGLKSRRFVSFVFGILIVEDLFAVLLLVILTTVSLTHSLFGSETILAGLKLAFYLVIWFVVGIFAIPAFLKKVRHLLSDETMLVVSLGLCLLMVAFASRVGFSPALGAFVMGSILAETAEAKRIERLLVPVRDLFVAIFFVSVGMLINPLVIAEHWGFILLISSLVIVGKITSVCIGGLLSGQRLKHSLQTAFSLAQIGEFSFIIAALGLTLKVTNELLYPVAVSVSVLTTFSTPFLIRSSDRVYTWLETRLPRPLLLRLDRYFTALNRKAGPNTISLLWRAYGLKITLNVVLCFAVVFSVHGLLLPQMRLHIGLGQWIDFSAGALCLILLSLFLWPIVFSAPSSSVRNDSEDLEKLRRLQFGVAIGRMILAMAILTFAVTRFIGPLFFGAGLMLFFLALVVLFLSRFAEASYMKFEQRFVMNFYEQDHLQRSPSPQPELAPWDAALSQFVMSPNSDLCAKTLFDCALKERFGTTVAMIERGNRRLLAPSRDDLLLPFDRVYLIGNEEQLEAARQIIEAPGSRPQADESLLYGLESILLGPKSRYIGQSIRNCGLREAINGLIVGLERREQRILSPDSSLEFEALDLLWVVGDRRLIRKVKSESEAK